MCCAAISTIGIGIDVIVAKTSLVIITGDNVVAVDDVDVIDVVDVVDVVIGITFRNSSGRRNCVQLGDSVCQ